MNEWVKVRIRMSEHLKHFFIMTSYNSLKRDNQHLDNKKVVKKTKEYLNTFEKNLTDYFLVLNDLVQIENMLEDIKKQSWELLDLITELKHCLDIINKNLENEKLENEIDNIKIKCKKEGVINTPEIFYEMRNSLKKTLNETIFNYTDIN